MHDMSETNAAYVQAVRDLCTMEIYAFSDIAEDFIVRMMMRIMEGGDSTYFSNEQKLVIQLMCERHLGTKRAAEL